MVFRIKKRWQIVGGVLALFGVLVLTVRVELSRTERVFKSRNGVRARMLMPKDLRQFAVEKYADKGESFVYRFSNVHSNYDQWTLEIVAKFEEAEKWREA